MGVYACLSILAFFLRMITVSSVFVNVYVCDRKWKEKGMVINAY